MVLKGRNGTVRPLSSGVKPEANRPTRSLREEVGFLLRRPHLELRALLGPYVDAQPAAPGAGGFHAAHVPAVAAIEPVGDAQDGGQIPDDGALLRSEHLEDLVAVLGHRAAVIARNRGDQL